MPDSFSIDSAHSTACRDARDPSTATSTSSVVVMQGPGECCGRHCRCPESICELMTDDHIVSTTSQQCASACFCPQVRSSNAFTTVLFCSLPTLRQAS